MPLPASPGSPVSADSSRSDLPGGTYRLMCLPLNLCAARPFWCGPKSYFYCARPTEHVCDTWPALMMPCRDCGLSSVSTRRRDACFTDACFSRHVGPVVLGRPAVRHLLRPPSQPVASVSLCAAGDTDARGLVTRDSEDSIVGVLEAAVRSCLLLQFFAFVHLLLRAVPMKRKAGSANCVIRGSRAAFRGAPLAFVLALCLTVAGAAPDRPGQCVESGTSPINVGGAQGNWVDVGQPTFEFDPQPGRPGRLVPGLSPVIGGDMLPQPSVAVQTLYLQRRHRFTAVSKADFRDAAELLCETAEALEVSGQGLQLYVVTPQPQSDCAVLLAAPLRCVEAGRLPVCIQAQDSCSGVTFWLEMFNPVVREDEIRDALGQDWREGSSIYVTNRRGPLLPGDCCEVFPGSLIHVVPPRGRPVPRLTLATKLCSEPSCLRDVSTDGFPSDEHFSHVYGLLQLLEPPRRVQFSPRVGGNCQDLEEVVLSHALYAWRPYIAVWPPLPVTDLHLRGRPVTLACGAFPRNLRGRAPVIVDGRHVGLGVGLYASFTGAMPFAVFLDSIGLFDPNHSLMAVEGTAAFNHQRRTIFISEGDLVVLYFRPESVPVPDAASVVEAGSGCHEDDDRHGLRGDDGSSDARSRSPRGGTADKPATRGVAASLRPLADAAGTTCLSDVGDSAADSCAIDELRNRVPVELFHPWLPPPVTVATFQTADLREHADPSTQTEGQLPTEGGESSGPDSDVEVDLESDPEAWRVPVKILAFQEVPKFDVLWVARHEPVESWLTRAQILLAPPDQQFDIVLPFLQPPDRFVHLLMVPKLWSQQGRVPVLVCDGRRPEAAYLESVADGEGFRDFLPLFGLPCDERVAVYRGTSREVVETDVVLQPMPGEVFFYQPLSWPPPESLDARRVLADHRCEWRAGDVLPQVAVPPLRYALLGQGEAVSLYDLQVGPVLPQIADATGIPRATLRIKTQVEPFHALCIHGQPAHRCLAYRDWAGASLQPMFVLFLDCRHLGVAVCARVVSRLQLTAADLLCLADAVVPDGLRVLVEGGTPVDGSPLHLQFYDGESVVVRTALPVQQDIAEPADSGESYDANQVDSTEYSPDVSSPRSRSPRRDVGGGRASSSGFGSAQHMWNSGLCNVHALSSCCREDTPVQDRKLRDEGKAEHSWTSHSPALHGLALGALAESPAKVADTVDSVVGAAALRRVPTPCLNSARWFDRGTRTGTGGKSEADCTAATGAHELTADSLACQPGQLLALQPDLHSDNDMDLTHSTLLCCSPHFSRHALLVKVCSFLEAQMRRHAHVPSSTVDDEAPLQLRLHDHLPARTFDLTALSVPVGKTLADVMDLLRTWEPNCWHTTPPEGLRLHSSTASVLASCRGTLVDLSQADLVHVYTDGSFDGSFSAWSVVCVPHHAWRPFCPFWLHGMVQLDSQSRTWLGAGQHGAQKTEISAVCVALLWALTLQGGVRFVLSSDSLVTIHRARGEWNYPSGHVLAGLCRALAQANEVFGIAPWQDLSHVPAHSGFGWNEYADVLAKLAVETSTVCTSTPDMSRWIIDSSFQHLWLLLAAHLQPHLWPTFSGAAITTRPASVISDLPAERYFGCEHSVPGPAGDTRWAHLHVVSMNVQTLEGEGVQHEEGRVGFLRDQMSSGAHVVLVQEARSQKAASVLSASYIRLCGGRSPTGQLGVEAWFRRDPPVGGVCFRPDDLVVIGFNPRLLAVKVHSEAFSGVLACIHAPTATDAVRDSWWETLALELDRLAANAPLVLAGDWNVRFTQSLHSRVGDLVWPDRDHIPPAVFRILEKHDLWLPSTFSDVHVGPSYTWFSPGHAHPSRLDYIAVPVGWICPSDASRTMPDIDLGHSSIDHVAVSLKVWHRVCHKVRRCKNQDGLYDRRAMCTPEGRRKLMEIGAGAPLLPWTLDASTHYHHVQRYLCSALQAAFPPLKRRVAQSFLTDATWLLKDYRIWLKRRVLRHKLVSRSFDITAALRAWRLDRCLPAAKCVLAAQLCGEARRMSQYVGSLRDTKLELRRSLRTDKSAYLQTLASDAGNLSTKEVMVRLRPILRPGGRKKSGYAGLPAVRLETGELALDVDQARDRWVRYFSGNEGGTRMPVSEAVQLYRDSQARTSLDFDVLRESCPLELP